MTAKTTRKREKIKSNLKLVINLISLSEHETSGSEKKTNDQKEESAIRRTKSAIEFSGNHLKLGKQNDRFEQIKDARLI